ncbi:MAG: GNAT family N-acetyltransferase [Candidatus Bipolaricaulota bacterium]
MNYIIEGERIGFTELREEYVELYRDWINDLEVSQFISHFGRVLTKEAENDWYKSQAESDEPTFTIHHLPEDKPIGNCGLHNINRGNDHGEMGILLGEKEYWNRGLGTEAVRLITDFGFAAVGLHGISLSVKSFNNRARRVYEKVGYQIAGRVRDFYKIDGSYYDEIIMDILREEFYKKNEQVIRDKYLKVLE